MGRISGWCNVCRKPVRNLGRHRRRHYPVTDLLPSTPPAATAVEPRPLTDASAVLCTPPAAARTPSAPANYLWSPPEWWTEVTTANEDWMTEPQCSVEPPEVEEAAGASAATAVQTGFSGASSPGTPVRDEIPEAAVQATSAEPSDIPRATNERLAPRLPEPAEARTVFLYAANPARSSSF